MPAGGGEPARVDHSEQGPIQSYAFSPDGRWLAYAKQDRTDYESIWIYDVKEREVHRVTGEDTDDGEPAWDPDGRYLYFLGQRHTNPLLGDRDLENVNIKPARPYVVLLRPDVDNPFRASAGLPPDDEDKGKDKDSDKAGSKGKGKKEDDAKSEAEETKPAPVEIVFDGLAERIVGFPVEAGRYSDLQATKARVFYLSTPLVGMADWGQLFGPSEPSATLMSFELDSKKAAPFAGGIGSYALSVKADKLALIKGPGEIYVVGAAAPPGDDLPAARVSLDGVVVELDPREEWSQIFYESWRQMRDFYWDAGMGGIEWTRIRDQYATLLPRLASRQDLQDLIAEMIGELSTSHTYVFGGDPGRGVPSRPTGLLGADLEREGGFFRVRRIYRGAPADEQRSPLLEPGVGIHEGDYVLRVNHQGFGPGQPFHASLEGRARKPVLLTVNSKPRLDGARDVSVVPLGSDQELRYADWVRCNREYVAEKTDGKIGYLHLPDMMQDGLIEFNTWFYPQLDREGLIVDVRWNHGGFVSQMIVERLRRPLDSFDRARGGGLSTYPHRTLNGPFVVLTNEHAGSDGDIFPAAVQLEKLAPVIGMRSWGGVVGISSIRPLVDGGLLTQPQSAWWEPGRGWAIENHGVDPDIVVQDLPQELAHGVDAQLDRGIAEVLRLHREHPPVKPEFGPVPPRGRDAYREREER